MKIVGIYSFNNGQEVVTQRYPHLFKEIKDIIENIQADKLKRKISKEKTMKGKSLHSPKALNKSFKKYFGKYKWKTVRVPCDYPTQYYLNDYKPKQLNKGAFREMDFIKEKLGVEVQFGKYSSMIYSGCAKTTIFQKMGFIDTGIEIVPVKQFAEQMSSGVSYFEQFIWDLEQRGISNIDIPVMILGIN